MLLKYRNSAVQAVSISQNLTKVSDLGERKRRSAAQRECAGNEKSEESALVNFFRQVVRKTVPDAKTNQCGIVVPMRASACKPDVRRSAVSAAGNVCSLKQATNELIARLGTETNAPEEILSAPRQETSAAIYKYRSKASMTYYDLPAIAVNQ